MIRDSLRGYFLLATKNLHDSNFFRTAVLMLEHNEEGAMGVIVNRPSSVNLAHALVGHFNVPPSENVIYVGGPVEPQALSMLHDNAEWGKSDITVLPNVFVGSSAEAFEEIIMGEPPECTSSFRVYSGYAGWGSGQLEGEVERGDWFTLKANTELVFSNRPYQLWDDLLQEYYRQHRILPIPAEKAEWN
ncbi:YqgE/AlgH family protein [Rubinisphaera italica]|uniref:UPF0301 protein Pan54_44390 n=1 Tax=Rubinisphaera italica TaxID=2527969 RepID=A0A5C5XMU1_9PLAN|nr:YqgE/AlgH family protein [Rubinisphaera italica]TWT63683.1 hypothetical protein Pan54_44390 [Rubinisphaera italica]